LNYSFSNQPLFSCDLKPENILIVRADAINDIIAENGKKSSSGSSGTFEDSEQWIKLIDFGSACFEGQTAHTYIQSRFYRSPEVLVGLPYDSAIDMWSLGCVAAELFLGLPILPGVHEHDQLGRILEMIGDLPEWMLERGTKCSKFFKVVTKKRGAKSNQSSVADTSDGSPCRTTWEFKTRQEYINSLTEEEKQSKGGLAKLEQQPTNRYFKKKRLEDIVMHHGVCTTKKEKEQLGLFVHFLKGVLDPDPWKRWTAKQASMHPFLTGSNLYRSKLGDIGPDGTRSGPKPYDIHWVPPWDASICRRKLLVVQKTKEGSRRNSLHGRVHLQQSVPEGAATQNQVLPAQGIGMYGTPMRNVLLNQQSPAVSISSQVAAMADAMRLSNNDQTSSPPQSLEALLNAQLSNAYPYSSNLSASLGANVGMGLPINYQPLIDASLAGRSLNENMHPSQLAAQQNIPTMNGLNDLAFLAQPPQQPTFMGAQSFSGMYYDGMPSHYPHVEGDLGYALQRPGVFPIAANDTVAMLQRQASGQSLAYLAQQNAILSSSLSNITATPRSAAQSAGSLNVKNSRDLLQQLGLQDQGSFDNYSQMNTGAATSLLAQQLADYSGQDFQQHHHINPQSFNTSNVPSIYGSMGAQMAESYHGMAGPMSLSSLPSYYQQQSVSLGNYGANMQDTQQQSYLAQINSDLMNMQNQTQNQMNNPNQNGQNGTSTDDMGNRPI
jgi:serine/threonine protein kinase